MPYWLFQGRDLTIELFLYQRQYLNAIQTTSPWILRYLATAVIINKSTRRHQVMKDLVKVIQEESYTYRDPITSFIEDLYVKFDFDGAQQVRVSANRMEILNKIFWRNCDFY